MKPAVIEWEGATYSYDPQQIDVQTAVAIKLHTGMGLRSWSKAVDDWDPVAVQALLWAVKKQNGETCHMASLNFSIADFMAVFIPAMSKVTAEVIAQMTDSGEDPSVAEVSTDTPTLTSAT